MMWRKKHFVINVTTPDIQGFKQKNTAFIAVSFLYVSDF